MRFNPKSRLDTGRVGDAGRGAGGGMQMPGGSGSRIPIPGGVGKGGIGGVMLVVLFIVLTQCLLPQLNGGDGAGQPGPNGNAQDGNLSAQRFEDSSGRYDNCKTGEDANNSADCARVAVENSLVDFWTKELQEFQPATAIVTFSGSVSTQCGGATSEVGPFYCPTDQTIYLDTTFFEQVLEGQLGGPAGDFVEPYVLAHEYGHHISNITGQLGKVQRQDGGPQSDSTRLELQADCYSGMWAAGATKTPDEGGDPLLTEIDTGDMEEALGAAKTVGDDEIQKKTQGRVNEEVWTHGSAVQRQKWFKIGYDAESMEECDTFSAKTV